MIPSAYLQEGLDFSDVFEAGDEHGFGWLNRRALWRRSTLLQSVLLSLFVHLAVIAAFVLTPRNAGSVRSPWLEVRLVSLGLEEVAAGTGVEGSAGGSPAMGSSVVENPPATALLPPEPPPLAVEKPREKDSKPAVNLAVACPRPVSKPKENPKTPVPQKEARDVEPISTASSPSGDAAATGTAAPAPALRDSGDGGVGAAGGAHGKERHGGHGGGPVDAEFGAANGPRFAHRSLPKYPRLARQLGKEGIVVLRVTIDESGHPIVVEAVKAAGSGFDEEAIKAVKESLFHPAKREGKPVVCRAILPIRFELRGSD